MLLFYWDSTARKNRESFHAEKNVDKEDVRALHGSLSLRRATYDTMLWQAPMISLTAEAFLLNIAMGKDACPFYMGLAAFASIIIGLASWQLFIRHSEMEMQTSEKLRKMEAEFFKLEMNTAPAHGAGLSNLKSKPIWRWCLFIMASIGIFPLLQYWLIPLSNWIFPF